MALQRVKPGLTPATKVTTKKKLYSDIDLSFTAKVGSPDAEGNYSGDIYKKLDYRAVQQAVENLLLTNTLEKPFEPSFGANLREMLFENSAEYSVSYLTDRIVTSVSRWEPRAVVTGVKFYAGGELISTGAADIGSLVSNTVQIVVEFQINNEGFTTSINMNRFR